MFSSILKCLRHDSKITWPLKSDVFFNGHKKLLEHVFLKPKTQVTISCDQDDPNHIFGYLVCEPPKIIHFVYVKRALREDGVASQLLDVAQIPKDMEDCYATHYTNISEMLRTSDKWRWTYNPYLMMEDLWKKD